MKDEIYIVMFFIIDVLLAIFSYLISKTQLKIIKNLKEENEMMYKHILQQKKKKQQLMQILNNAHSNHENYIETIRKIENELQK